VRLYILSSKYLNAFQLKVVEPLLNSDRIRIVGVCIDNRKPKSVLQRFKRSWRKGRGGYIIVAGIGELIEKFKQPINISAEHFFKTKNIPVYLTENLYTPETINRIKSHKPDCIALVGGFGIIKEPVLTLASQGVISYHHGDIRKYRGRPPGFWELYNNEKEMGITIQILDKGLDCGKIVLEKKIPIYPTDTWGALRQRASEKSIDMMFGACMLIENSNFIPKTVKERELGAIYTSPNFRKWFILQTKILWRKLKAFNKYV